MRLLVDSHVAVWWLGDPSKLSTTAKEAIASAGNEVYLSVASIWELLIKRSNGKLTIPDDFVAVLKEDGFSILDIKSNHALRIGSLPMIHRDPFDRMLIAQTIEEGLVLATRDSFIRQYSVPLIDA